MKMSKTFREKNKQKVLGGKSAKEQSRHCQFVLENKRGEFSGTKGEEQKGKQIHTLKTHHTHTRVRTRTSHSGGFSDVACSRIDRFLSAGSLCHPESIKQAVARRHFSGMTVLMIKDFLVEFSFPDKLVLS